MDQMLTENEIWGVDAMIFILLFSSCAKSSNSSAFLEEQPMRPCHGRNDVISFLGKLQNGAFLRVGPRKSLTQRRSKNSQHI